MTQCHLHFIYDFYNPHSKIGVLQTFNTEYIAFSTNILVGKWLPNLYG